MRWRMGTQAYLPLVLLFWLFASAGSFALGVGLRQTPEGLNGVTTYMSQGVGSLLASLLGSNAYAAQSEVGPSVPTTVPVPPKPPTTTTTHTTPTRPTPPAPPTKVNQNPGPGANGNDKHKGHNGDGKDHKGKGGNGNDDAGDSDD